MKRDIAFAIVFALLWQCGRDVTPAAGESTPLFAYRVAPSGGDSGRYLVANATGGNNEVRLLDRASASLAVLRDLPMLPMSSTTPAPAHGGRDRGVGLQQRLAFDRGAVSDVGLARVCLYEADRRLADCAAIWDVAQRVQPADPVGFLRRYSTLERSRSARARRIRSEPPPKTMLAFAGELMAGKHRNRCPGARHWGSREDGSHGRMVLVQCERPTANLFYRVRRA